MVQGVRNTQLPKHHLTFIVKFQGQKFILLALHGQKHTPIKLKSGMEEYTIGILLHAKFRPDWQRGLGHRSPKIYNLVKFAAFWQFSPTWVTAHTDQSEI